VAEHGDGTLRLCAKHPKPIEVLLYDVVTPGLGAGELSRIAVGMDPGLRVLLMRFYPGEFPSGLKILRLFQLMLTPFATSELVLRLEAMSGGTRT
jgi:hypothetical protein